MKSHLKLNRILVCAVVVGALIAAAGCKHSPQESQPSAATDSGAAAVTGAAVVGNSNSKLESATANAAAESNDPAVVYQRRRSELYDLAVQVDSAMDEFRHRENFARTTHRLGGFTASLSPEGIAKFNDVLTRMNHCLWQRAIDETDVVVRADALLDSYDRIATDVMTGAAPEQLVRTRFNALRTVTDEIKELRPRMGNWNLWMARDYNVVSARMDAALPGHPDTLKQESVEANRLITTTRHRFLRGALTASDLFEILAALRVTERSFILTGRAESGMSDLLAQLSHQYAEAMPKPSPVSREDRAAFLADIAADAAWLEQLLEPHLLTYPWPWSKDAQSTPASAPSVKP